MTQVLPSEHLILEILKKRGLLSSISLRSVVGFMEAWGIDSYRAVVETHSVEESRLADILAEEYHLIRIARLRSRPVDRKALAYVTYQDAMNFDLLPYGFEENGALQVAIADPTRKTCLETLSQSLKTPLVMHVAERCEIEASIQRHYPLSMQLPGTMSTCVSSLGEGFKP